MTVVDSTDLENEVTGFEGGSVEGNVIPMHADSSLELIAAQKLRQRFPSQIKLGGGLILRYDLMVCNHKLHPDQDGLSYWNAITIGE